MSARRGCRGALSRVEPHHSVLLIGTGLTMVDTALTLAERNHEGRIHALSRHGKLPHVHQPGVAASPRDALSAPGSMRSLVKTLRREASDGSADWRGVVDGLRPTTASLWRGLSESERRRFLRHLRAYWDVHRHRMAPAVDETLQSLRRSGTLRLHAGRLRGFELMDEQWVEVRARPRGVIFDATFRVQHVINCTGPDVSLGRGHPLLRNLLESGLGRTDALGLGLDTDAEGALLDAEGRVSGALFTLGSLRRGELWESTALPEIRAQASVLARSLLARLSSRTAPDAHPLATSSPSLA